MIDLIQLLINDPVINAMIGSHIYANATTYMGDCIVYEFYPVSNDKIKKHSRLKITIIAQDIAHTEMIENRVNDVILTLGDEKLVADILHVEQNGGGTLFDAERNKQHRILYYDVLQRT